MYEVLIVLAVILVAVALYFALRPVAPPTGGEVVDDREIANINQFLVDSRTYNDRTLSQRELYDLRNRGWILMRRTPYNGEMGYHTPSSGSGVYGRGWRGGYRWQNGPYYRYYTYSSPSWFYDIWNTNYFNFYQRYCWVRGYDGDWYAVQYVNGRCPLDLLRY